MFTYAYGYKSKDAAEEALDTACTAGQVSEWEAWKAVVSCYTANGKRRWQIKLPE